MIRYGFNIRTRSGQRVENISIVAQSATDAERRLRQMYDRCQIIDCLTQAVGKRAESLDFSALIEMISAAEPPCAIASGNEPGAH
jgi:hypothetical protein